MKIDGRWLGGGLAAIAVGGALGWLFAERKAEKPRYRPLMTDGAIQLRMYQGFVTAAATAPGSREAATRDGFRRLARFISGRDRGGGRIAMTAPVLVDDAGDGWRTRFVMPAALRSDEVPAIPAGLTVGEERLGRVVAISFTGRADDAILADQEAMLRAWIASKGLRVSGNRMFAFYNSPFMPAPLRRNEVLIPVG